MNVSHGHQIELQKLQKKYFQQLVSFSELSLTGLALDPVK